ncbi:MAG: hypothetical protein ACFFDU_01050 [Candidatus Thorarchaeota archaeon]
MGFLDRLKTPKGTINVIFDKEYQSLREGFSGALQVSASEEFNAEELRLEIHVTEWTQATEQRKQGDQTITVTAKQTKVLHQGKHAVYGQIQFTNGFSQQIPFNVHLPPGIPPTYQSQNVRTTWLVKGVIEVSGRPDITSHETEIKVTY